MQLDKLPTGETAVVTSIKLGNEARKKLLGFGIGLGSKLSREYSPTLSSLVKINISGKSICLRIRDAKLIGVVKYHENE